MCCLVHKLSVIFEKLCMKLNSSTNIHCLLKGCCKCVLQLYDTENVQMSHVYTYMALIILSKCVL